MPQEKASDSAAIGSHKSTPSYTLVMGTVMEVRYTDVDGIEQSSVQLFWSCIAIESATPDDFIVPTR
jgi:hypothetical protein